MQFSSKILSATWDEDSGKWLLEVSQNGKTKADSADIFVNGAGFLNKWKWPNIEGLSDFKGKLVHTADWDADYDLEGKRVAVIGNGSSGIQVVPAIQPKVSKVVNYVRNPTWISINICAEQTKDGHNYPYTVQDKKRFREDPGALFELRRKLETR